MKKKFIPAFLFVCSALLTIGFVIRLYFDYTIHYEFGSAPFWLYIAVRFAEFMILAIGCFVAGIIMQKKAKGNTPGNMEFENNDNMTPVLPEECEKESVIE